MSMTAWLDASLLDIVSTLLQLLRHVSGEILPPQMCRQPQNSFQHTLKEVRGLPLMTSHIFGDFPTPSPMLH